MLGRWFSRLTPSESVYELLVNVQSIHSTSGAFAAVVGTGIGSSVITWGRDDHGGDSSSVKHLLKNVLMVKGNALAFAALRGDGTVVSWGSCDDGGDSSAVADQIASLI